VALRARTEAIARHLSDFMQRTVNLMPAGGHIAEVVAQSDAPLPASNGFIWTSASSDPETCRHGCGSIFAEQPGTIGRGKLAIGLAYQHLHFGSLAGQPLNNLYTTAVVTPAVTNASTTSLDIAIDRGIISATYGLTGRIDMSIVVPVGRTSVAGVTHGHFVCTAPTAPFCPDGTTAPRTFSETASASGFGDVAVRGKVSVFSSRSLNIAAGLQIRPPTGDLNSLLGTGKTQVTLSAIAATVYRQISPHFNVGYTAGGDGPNCSSRNRVNCIQSGEPEPSPEVDYLVGVDLAAGNRVSVSGDLMGRSLRKAANIGFQTFTITGLTERLFPVTKGVVNLAFLSLGSNVRVLNNWVIAGSVVLAVSDNWLRPEVAPVIAFGRRF